MATKVREISPPIRKLYQAFLLGKRKSVKKEEENAIIVNEVVGAMALFYERIRNLMNDAEEHLFRKSSIERYLTRRFFFKSFSLREFRGKNGHDYEIDLYTEWSKTLISDLIRARYLPNKIIPESKIGELAWIMKKHHILRESLLSYVPQWYRKELNNFILNLLASEIEESLVKNEFLSAQVGSLYELLHGRVNIVSKVLTPEEKDIQLYIAVLKTILKADVGLLRYHLFLLYFPQWHTVRESDLQNIILHFVKGARQIDHEIGREINLLIVAKIKPFAVSYHVLREFSEEDPEEAYRQIQIPQEFKKKVGQVLDKHYRKVRLRLIRNVWRSVVYIFVTKMIVAFLLEFPYDLYVTHKVNYTALAINVFFPPFLMFLLTITVQISAKKNTEQVLLLLNKIIFKETLDAISLRIRPRVKWGFLLRNTFRIFYFAIYAIIFFVIIRILRQLEFNLVNIIIFIFFLFIISFFSMRIRILAKDMIIIPRKENIFTLILDVIGIPIVRAGRWLNNRLSRINIFIFFLDFFIEAPFKFFVTLIEGWTGYLKEKKEEVY